jgi:hypothetical protein
MANRYAVATGNWSAPATWDGGTLPGVGDVVRANNFTVTIDQDIDVGQLRTDAAAPAVNGGTFLVATIPGGGRTITAGLVVGYTAGISVSAPSGVLTVNADLESISTTYALTFLSGALCTVIVNGDVTISTSGAGGAPAGIFVSQGPVTLIVNGNATGGGGGAGTRPAIQITVSTATVTLNGDAIGGTGSPGVLISNGALTVTGACIGGAGATSDGVRSTTSNPTVDAQGAVTAGSIGHGILAAAGLVRARGPLTDHSSGRTAVMAQRRILHASPADTDWTVRDDAGFPTVGAAMVLTNIGNGMPDPADVAAGVVYGAAGEHTGTMPTSALTAAAVWDVLVADLDTAASIGLRLRDTATVDTVGAQIAAGVGD